MLRPFVMFAVSDHLSDTAVRLCPAFARGVWIDMLCLMHTGEPYGYLRRESIVCAPPRVPPQDAPRSAPPRVPPQDAPRSAPPRVPPQDAPADEVPALPANGSLETLLPYLTMTPPSVVAAALEILEARGVFSREKEGKLAGIIYSRRMRREHETRQRKIEAQQRGSHGKPGDKSAAGQSAPKTGGSRVPPQQGRQDAPLPAPPHVPPLRSRTRSTDTTTNPPDPPLPGGASRNAGKPPNTPKGTTARSRGTFDDDAIRRRMSLNDRAKGKKT
jgi:hypothetical protein